MNIAYGLDTPRDLDWRARGRCAQPDVQPGRWHTDRQGDVGGLTGWARHICLQHCPVLAQCHADAENIEAFLRQSCVLGGVIYDCRGRPASIQRLDPHCTLCRPAAGMAGDDPAAQQQRWREDKRRNRGGQR